MCREQPGNARGFEEWNVCFFDKIYSLYHKQGQSSSCSEAKFEPESANCLICNLVF